MATGMVAAQAQTCYDLLYAYFQGHTEYMDVYPQEKLDAICEFGKAALYESDTIPVGADIYSITAVKDLTTGEALAADYVVDLRTLLFYSYNFHALQLEYPHGDQVICFATPSSRHPYLVLRSIEQMYKLEAEAMAEHEQMGLYD